MLFGSCAWSCLWSALYGVCCGLWGNKGKKMSNYNYVHVLMIGMIFCLVIEYLPNEDFVINSNLDKIFGTHGIQIVYRTSMAFTFAFTFMFIMTLCWPFLHHMFLLVFIVILGLFIWLCIWGMKSEGQIITYRNISRIASFVYLTLQLASFVDLAFTFHDWLMEKMEETNKKYSYTDKTCCCKNQYMSFYIFTSYFFLIVSIGGCIALFFIFRVNGGVCGSNILSIIVTMLAGLICCGLSISDSVSHGFLAPTTFFFIIVIYLVLSLISNPDTKCNPYTTHSTYFISVVNVVLFIVSSYWMAYRVKGDYSKDEVPADTEKGEKPEVKIPEDDGFECCMFNACMIAASIYLAMMCSAWYNGSIYERPAAIFNFTDAATSWIYRITIFIGFLLFLYVLVAPLLVKSRKF